MKSAGQRLVILGIFTVVVIIFLIRLFYIQVIEESYTISANNNVLRYMIDYPARGMIYDRKGKTLAFNQTVYDLMVIPRQVKEMDTVEFCRLIDIPIEDFRDKIKKARQFSGVKASIFEKQLSAETYAGFQEKLYRFPGFYVQPRTLRKYPFNTAAHLLGYIGEVNEDLIKKNPYYVMGDYIGISGIEQSYESELRGKRGVRIVMVDVFNREKGSYRNGVYDTLGIPGVNLTSTIDAKLQSYGETLMQNKVGSILAIEPQTGEILALVSSPSYDPNLLVGRVRGNNYARMVTDPLLPLYNRALMSYYPPGSTFKPVMSLIGQQEKTLYPNTTYFCNGGYHMGSITVKCDAHHGNISLLPAIQHSCNTYYCNVFRAVIDNKKYSSTEEAFESWRKNVMSFGLGTKLDIDLPHVLSGNVPTVKYYDKYFGKGRWRSSTIISLSIGQGELGVSPLQLANVAATIANRGYYYLPHVIKYIGDNKTQLKKYTTPHYTTVDSSYFGIVVDGMENVVEAGTAAASKIKGITICGKTGTAQNPHGKDNSLFICFAPKENPKIALAIVVENGGWGAQWAAPIASLMIEKYLSDSISRPAIEQRMIEGNLINQVLAAQTHHAVSDTAVTKPKLRVK
jgi:penicillin-binding protein 2